ncbi:TPA: GNAT family N-acetyltransferase [Klebsiella pneumoniae]
MQKSQQFRFTHRIPLFAITKGYDAGKERLIDGPCCFFAVQRTLLAKPTSRRPDPSSFHTAAARAAYSRPRHDYLETEHSLLAVAAGQPVGFILTEPLDDALFIVEVAVHQAWQQQGIGRMLLERVIESARQMGYPAVTLTTFREVPWNAPFYTRLGFAMLDELTLPAGLAAKREQETRHGLPPESRCAMRLAL